jgi:hypothetical protein
LPIGSGTKLNPNAGIIKALTWQGSSFYDALEVEIRKNISHGLQIQGPYTWAKNIDTGSASLAADAFLNSVTSPLLFDMKLERGLWDFNIGQNLVINSTWEVPALKLASGVAEWVLSGWELGGIYKASSGVPFTVRINGDALGENSFDPYDVSNRVSRPNCRTLTNPGNPDKYIKTQCFTFPVPANLRGNAGRNVLIGPGLSNFDFALFKNNQIKRISENFNVQFRIELFDIFNRTNFSPPLSNTCVFDRLGNPIASAGKITSTQTTSREIQLALKLIW